MTRKAPKLSAILWAVGALTVLWIAVDGGEYGSIDIIRQRQQRQRLQHEIDSLTRVVDSLRSHRQRVLSDAATQERIAREEFGMIRGKELLYRIAEPVDPPSRKTP
jgi:cell division protein FtsB